MSKEKIKIEKLGGDKFKVSGGEGKEPSGPVKREEIRREVKERR